MNWVIAAVKNVFNRPEPAEVDIVAMSPYQRLHQADEHAHSPSMVYPTLANGVPLTGGAAWTLGALVEIVPASTITDKFDIHHLSIEDLSAIEVYEIVLYYGAGDTECGRVRITKSTNNDGVGDIPFQTVVIPANERIRAAVATEGGSDTATISIKYHLY